MLKAFPHVFFVKFVIMTKLNLGKGGSYAGPSIKRILRETLDDLEQMLPPDFGKPVADYLRAISHVYELCMAEAVSGEEEVAKVWATFRKTFNVLKVLLDLRATLKIHIILGITILCLISYSIF